MGGFKDFGVGAGVAQVASAGIDAMRHAGDAAEDHAQGAAQDIGGFARREEQGFPRDELEPKRIKVEVHGCAYRDIIQGLEEISYGKSGISASAGDDST